MATAISSGPTQGSCWGRQHVLCALPEADIITNDSLLFFSVNVS